MTDDTPLFGSWLDETKQLQIEAYGTDYSQLHPYDETNLPRLVEYLAWNTKAATHELVELDSETSWKPWQHDKPYVNRDAVIMEAIDVLHFAANILCAVDCSTDELNAGYARKMAVNRRRQLQGYVLAGGGAVRLKCARCGRALDDGSVEVSADGSHCVSCGTA